MRYGWFYIGISTFFMAVSAQGNELLQAKKVAAAERYIIAEVMVSQSKKKRVFLQKCYESVSYDTAGSTGEGMIALLGTAASFGEPAAIEGLIHLLGVQLDAAWGEGRSSAIVYGGEAMAQSLQQASARQIHARCVAHFEQLTQALRLTDVPLAAVCQTETTIQSALDEFHQGIKEYRVY